MQYPEARLAWLTLIKTGRRKQRRGSAPGSSSQAHKKSSLPGSRAAVNSVTYSLSSSSEGGWPGRPDAWRATGPRHRGSQPEPGSQTARPEPVSPPEPPLPPEPVPESGTELPLGVGPSPEPGERRRRSERLSRRQSTVSQDKEGTDTSWQFVRTAGSTSDLAQTPPQTFNVLLNQAGGERLRRSVSVGLPPPSAPLSPRQRYRSHGDVTLPAPCDVTFSRPDAYDERDLPLRRSHWDPLNYGSGRRHGRSPSSEGSCDTSQTVPADCGADSLPPPPELGEETSPGPGETAVGGRGSPVGAAPLHGGERTAGYAGTDTLVSRSRLAVSRSSGEM